jgi:hypothetical protein
MKKGILVLLSVLLLASCGTANVKIDEKGLDVKV